MKGKTVARKSSSECPDRIQAGSDTSKMSYKVFISSAYRDNIQRRNTLQQVITMAGMLWHGMELFTAGPNPVAEECLRLAGEADVFVGIIAWRYGWEPGEEAHENGTPTTSNKNNARSKDRKRDAAGISITEMEYDAARKAGKETLMFLIGAGFPKSGPGSMRSV